MTSKDKIEKIKLLMEKVNCNGNSCDVWCSFRKSLEHGSGCMINSILEE